MTGFGMEDKVNKRLVIVAIAITAVMVVASTSVIAAKGGNPDKPADDGGPLGSGYFTTGCRFDDSTIIWQTSESVKGHTSVKRLKAYDLGANGAYNDDDDGEVTVLGTPAYTDRFDIQGDYIVWAEFGPPDSEGNSNADLYYWEFDSDEVISSENGERAGLQLSTTLVEDNPNIWGENVVFRTYPVDYGDTRPTFTYYIRNFGDEDAVKLDGVAYVELWDNYLAIEEADGDNAIVDLGTNGKFDDFSTDIPTTISGLNGWSLNVFEFGCAVYYLKDEEDGTYDWKYLKLDPSSGEIDGPYALWSDTEGRGFMETNGEVITYQKVTQEKRGMVWNIVLYSIDEESYEQITDLSRYAALLQDIDGTRLMYTYQGLMYLYYFEDGTHVELS